MVMIKNNGITVVHVKLLTVHYQKHYIQYNKVQYQQEYHSTTMFQNARWYYGTLLSLWYFVNTIIYEHCNDTVWYISKYHGLTLTKPYTWYYCGEYPKTWYYHGIFPKKKKFQGAVVLS